MINSLNDIIQEATHIKNDPFQSIWYLTRIVGVLSHCEDIDSDINNDC